MNVEKQLAHCLALIDQVYKVSQGDAGWSLGLELHCKLASAEELQRGFAVPLHWCDVHGFFRWPDSGCYLCHMENPAEHMEQEEPLQ